MTVQYEKASQNRADVAFSDDATHLQIDKKIEPVCVVPISQAHKQRTAQNK